MHPALLPLNEHNQKLRHQVHPSEWVNPQPAESYNLVVIGAGTAGLVTAFGGAGLGGKVALIERHLLGGDCLNVGCVPSKCLISPARLVSDLKRAQAMGAHGAEMLKFDFAKVMDRMREIRAGISPHDSAWRCKELGVDLFLGEGRFLSSSVIEVAGKKLPFKKAVIATGAHPTMPLIPGLQESGCYTNETIFSLTELPQRLVVIGGGPIGCELAQAFARLGSEVTILQREPQFLVREDPDAALILAESFKRDSIQVRMNCTIHKVTLNANTRQVHITVGDKDESIPADVILVAAGRTPNIDGLNLNAVGVQFDRQRGVLVNDYLQTTNPAIYAAGDICSAYKFTHTADAFSRLVLGNALFMGRGKQSGLTIPWCTYTDPEIAHVGMYEREAKAQGISFDTYTTPFKQVDRALAEGDTEGFVKIHVRRGSGQILGATIVGTGAGDMISEITVAMVHKIPLGKLANVIHPYPTRAEAIRKTADAYNRTRLTPMVKKIFSTWLALNR
jgi:pyruvate/2-oxoglutarate dehydrogenase complex dihydrolipoamide dehydrogenase (E3) component